MGKMEVARARAGGARPPVLPLAHPRALSAGGNSRLHLRSDGRLAREAARAENARRRAGDPPALRPARPADGHPRPPVLQGDQAPCRPAPRLSRPAERQRRTLAPGPLRSRCPDRRGERAPAPHRQPARHRRPRDQGPAVAQDRRPDPDRLRGEPAARAGGALLPVAGLEEAPLAARPLRAAPLARQGARDRRRDRRGARRVPARRDFGDPRDERVLHPRLVAHAPRVLPADRHHHRHARVRSLRRRAHGPAAGDARGGDAIRRERRPHLGLGRVRRRPGARGDAGDALARRPSHRPASRRDHLRAARFRADLRFLRRAPRASGERRAPGRPAPSARPLLLELLLQRLMQQLLLELAPPPPPTLENFCPGGNGAAIKALRDALGGGERFVFLWGPGGSGKTHLLRAFAAAGAAAGLEVATADDVARLDDPGQIALFDLCNRLRASKGALAASAGAPPARLALRPDLRSRLASGIVLQLRPLSDADKAAALLERALERGMALDRDLIAYLLTHFDRDMGTQIAVLDALDRYSLQRKRAITLPLLKEALRSLAAPEADA